MRMNIQSPAVLLCTALLLLSDGPSVEGFQNLFAGFSGPPSVVRGRDGAKQLEDQLVAAIDNQGSRLANSDEITSLVQALENSRNSIPEPAIAPEVYGRWRLLYTTNADTSSPIQRKAVDTQKFPIYQDIVVNQDDQLQVNQVVKFSDSAILSVDALASTAAYPLPELTDRKGTGKDSGIKHFGCISSRRRSQAGSESTQLAHQLRL